MPIDTADWKPGDGLGPGFAARVKELGLIPKTPELYWAPGVSVMLTDKGDVWYSAYTNEVLGPFVEPDGQ